VLEDPWVEPPDDVFTLTRAPQGCPDEPAYVEIDFENGVPVRANGIDMPLVELIESLETIGGAHGVGRIDMVENRLVGIKSREIYEAPAAVVLHAAHSELQKIVIARDLERIAHDLGRAYADLVYNGLWFSHTRDALDAFVRAIQPRVTGTVRLKLFKGDCRVVGRKSPYALYDLALATYGPGDAYQHGAADGFIRIWGLPVEIAARQAAAARPESVGR
jgi:argininosuccinate synthase